MNALSRPIVKALGLVAAVLFATTACAASEAPTGSRSGASESRTVASPAENTTSPAGAPSQTDAPSPSEHSSSDEPSPDRDGTAASGPGSEPLPDDEINALSPYDDENAEPAFPDTDEVHVVGVPEGSGLNIRLTPGVGPDGDVIASAGPMDRLTLTGREGFFVDEGRWWIEIVTDSGDGGDLYGWVNRQYVATFGPAADVTEDVADAGSGPDAEELILHVADHRAPEGEPGPEYQDTGTERTIVRSPQGGVGAWTVDLIGGYRGGEDDSGDRSHGERLEVELQDSGGQFTVSSVQSTKLCSGAFDDGGVCG
ncbi:hypothetical protein ACWG8W_14935 [Citricoccus zhacaiensis]